MSRALVTGAAGFIGRHAARELAQRGHEVVGIGRGTWSEASAWGVSRYLDGGLSPSTLPEGPFEIVVHCAGGSSVAQSMVDPIGHSSDGISPLLALLEWCKAPVNRNARLVFVSSGAVYGIAPILPIPESADVRPISVYGATKAHCEDLCRMYGRTSGVSSSVVRLFSVYGAGLKRQLLWDAACKGRAGNSSFSGSGREKRDWLHVADAARLLVAASDHTSALVPTFNGGTGLGTSVDDVVGRLYRELGVEAAPVFDGSTRSGDPPDYVADMAKVSTLAWQPQISLADGIASYARWFLEQA